MIPQTGQNILIAALTNDFYNAAPSFTANP